EKIVSYRQWSIGTNYHRRVAGPFPCFPKGNPAKTRSEVGFPAVLLRRSLTATDDLFQGTEAQTRDTTRLPRISARLNWISIPTARRLAAMRRSALPS